MTELGNSIEEYHVGEQLGKGGFAVVYRGRCQNTGREVAIKKIDKGKIAAGGLINRVRQEVTIHSQLSHPAILKLFTFFEDQQYVYLILELCLNGELQRYIKSLRRVLSEGEAREYLSQIVSGMLYLHSNQIIHRDLTLSNLLLDDQGRIKIADFGLATQLRRPDDRHTTMCGTPNYISPEVATRSSHGLESDVWSLGCMLFIMLVGHPPFDGEGVKESIFTRVVIGDYKIPEYVSMHARSLISECLQKNPAERIKLTAIPQHLFMTLGNKDISRMSDSGLYTMSTMTSANHTRMPLSVISESNVSGIQNSRDFDQHLVKPQNNATRKHPFSPPVRMKSSPRDLLPPNAGVIDTLKKKFNPLPSLKRGEDFAFAVPSSHNPKRERDISEERQRHLQRQYSREGSVSSNEEKSDSSPYSSSHVNDNHHHQRGSWQRGNSGLTSEQSEDYGFRNQRDLGKENQHFSRSHEYNQQYKHCTREQTYEKFGGHRSRSVDRLYSEDTRQKVKDYDNQVDRGLQRSQSKESSLHRDRSFDHSTGNRRYRSEERSRDSSQRSFNENSQIRDRESSRERVRGNTPLHHRSPSSDNFRDNSLERHRDKLREPEHRSHREELRDNRYGNPQYSCCQSSRHPSWCEKGKTKDSRSGSFIYEQGNIRNDIGSEHKNIMAKGLRPASPQRGSKDKMLNDIPPVNLIPQSAAIKGKDTVSYSYSKDQRNTAKRSPNKGSQTIQQQVSPLCSKRLKATRQNTKNAILNILDNGEICLEFLRSRDGRNKVIDVCRISPDGMRIVLYQPNGGSGCVPGDTPVPLPTEGTDSIFSYENLPPKYWKKYIYASRFVKVVKAKTPKITYYSEQAKCMLMENSPDPDFEAVFYNGLKIISSGNDLTIKEVSGSMQTVTRTSAPSTLQENLHPSYLHFREVRDHCLYLERVLTEVSEKTSLNSFPVVMGRKPPGMTTPPVSARGDSHPIDDKENIPLMPSFRSPGTVQIGSFQESVASIQTVRSYSTKTQLAACAVGHDQDNAPISCENPGPRVFINNIGWATQGANGVVSVEYLDGTHVLVSSNDPKVIFTDETKVTKTYSTSNKLPLVLQQKLSQMKMVLDRLAQSAYPVATSHRVGLR